MLDKLIEIILPEILPRALPSARLPLEKKDRAAREGQA